MDFRSILALSLVLAVSACGDGSKEAKQLVKESLGRHRSLEFIDVQTFPGPVVCGEYFVNQSTQPQSFITVRGLLYKQPSDWYWEFFCTETSANVLLEKTGIGPYNAISLPLAQITKDLFAITSALEAYYSDQFYYPTVEQGLQALVSPPDNIRHPARYPAQGYLSPIPLDPWGRAYIYEEERWGGSKGIFTVTTLGQDGIAGGTGEKADISTKFLVELQHQTLIVENQ